MLATELSDNQLKDIEEAIAKYEETGDEQYVGMLRVYAYYFKDYDGDDELIKKMLEIVG